jgi:transcription initiation factor IIE alpha subunit
MKIRAKKKKAYLFIQRLLLTGKRQVTLRSNEIFQSVEYIDGHFQLKSCRWLARTKLSLGSKDGKIMQNNVYMCQVLKLKFSFFTGKFYL